MIEIEDVPAMNYARLRDALFIIRLIVPGPDVMVEEIEDVASRLIRLMGRNKARRITTKLPLQERRKRKKKQVKASTNKR